MPQKKLLIAEAANPEWVSVPLVGWSMAKAISKTTPSHLVTHIRNRSAISKTGLKEGDDFSVIDSDAIARPLWRASKLLRGNSGVSWTTGTAFSALAYYYFEFLVWKRFGNAIRRGDFDIVHRITPLSPTVPSLLAAKCRKAGIPFIIGPLNGGVSWPKGFESARRKEREWLSYVRWVYKLLPGYRSGLKASSALLAGSLDTLRQIPHNMHHKCIYLPENAINPERFSSTAQDASPGHLRACFVGRLVPYKGPDMLLEAMTPLLRSGRLQLDIIGDGPMMSSLRAYVENSHINQYVKLHGWVEHKKVPDLMCQSQLLVFPSIREFGGGVVLEAMALGLVPVVINYAGPGELVTPETGFKIPIGNRDEIIANLRKVVESVCDNPAQLNALSSNARNRVATLFTWDAKAAQIIQIYEWVLGRREKPVFFPNSDPAAL